MSTALRRVLGTLLLVLTAALLTAPPASANSTVSGTVTITDDLTTPLNGTVWFEPVPSTGSYGGVNLTNGTFSTSGFADGDYKIRISMSSMDGYSRYFRQGDPQGTTDASLATVLTLGGPTPLPAIDIAFPRIATLSGHVTNGDGDPMPGVTVALNRLGSGKQAPPTDATGFYDFGYLRPGTVNVLVNASGSWAGAQSFVTMPTSGQQTADLVLVAQAHLAGTLTDAGSGDPVAGLDVTAYRTADTAYIGSDVTDGVGHYSIGGLGAGDYVLRYSDPLLGYPSRWNGGAVILAEAEPLTTTAGQTLTHDEALTQVADPCEAPAACVLSGVVGDGASPLAGIDVTAYDASGAPVGVDSTDRSGRWGIENLPDGDYRLGFAQGDTLTNQAPTLVPWFPEFHPDVWGLAAATPVTVSGGVGLAGIATELGRAGRITIPVKGPGGSTDLNAGYRVVSAVTGATVFERAPVANGGNQLAVLVRPGSWKILVTGRAGLAVNAPQLLGHWYGGGTTVAAAPALGFAAGDDVAGATTRLAGKLVATKSPKVKGTPRVGSTLTVANGQWTLMTDTTFAYRWKRGSQLLGRAASLVVHRADAGKTLKVVVTAKNGQLRTPVTLTVAVRS